MAEETLLKPEEEITFADAAYKETVDAGVFYGRSKSRTNPRMKRYILGNRNEIEIIDLSKTKDAIDRAGEFLQEKASKGENILFVGTQPAAESIVSFGKEFGYPVVSTRWLGGTLTNFRVILKRIEYYVKLKTDWANNAFAEKYTKKERIGIERELRRLEELFAGLEALKSLPSAVVILDPNLHLAALREANLLHIPVVAYVNTDADPDLVTYLVPGNTKARMSIEWFFDRVKQSIREGKVLAAKAKEAKEAQEAAAKEKVEG